MYFIPDLILCIYICIPKGFVELPAGAIKDAEGVGECAQVFFVSECQDDGGDYCNVILSH